MSRTILMLIIIFAALPAFAQADNAQITQMFAEDQAIRNDDAQTDWAAAQAEDANRRRLVQKLMDDGKLKSANDFYHAAFIFQHGEDSSDYLKAHALAIIAVSKGRDEATWIAAATLDRYLHSIGQKQIFGTQYRFPTEGTVTQDPYDRVLLSDAMRTASRVPDLAAQEKKLKEIATDISQ